MNANVQTRKNQDKRVLNMKKNKKKLPVATIVIPSIFPPNQVFVGGQNIKVIQNSIDITQKCKLFTCCDSAKEAIKEIAGDKKSNKPKIIKHLGSKESGKVYLLAKNIHQMAYVAKRV